MTKFFITKHALSTGIAEVEANPALTVSGMIEALGSDNGWAYTQYYHGEGREWHRTREAAIARAEAMRKAKIGSLMKSIAKLEKLDFSSTHPSSEGRADAK